MDHQFFDLFAWAFGLMTAGTFAMFAGTFALIFGLFAFMFWVGGVCGKYLVEFWSERSGNGKVVVNFWLAAVAVLFFGMLTGGVVDTVVVAAAAGTWIWDRCVPKGKANP